MRSLYTGTGLSPILGPGKASDNACRLQAPWLACPDWEAFGDKEKRSVHRVFDVKGRRHFAVFPVFLGWSAGRTQLHQSSTCDRASVHRLWVWAITQALSSECHPRGTNLRSQWFKNHHPQELNSSAVGNYISSEQRWVNHEVNEACSSEPLLAPATSKSQGGPRAVVETEDSMILAPHRVFCLPFACGKLQSKNTFNWRSEKRGNKGKHSEETK